MTQTFKKKTIPAKARKVSEIYFSSYGESIKHDNRF